MDRHENRMSDKIQHRTHTWKLLESPSPSLLSLHLQALSCATSRLPYPSIPGVAQKSLFQVTHMEDDEEVLIQRNPMCSTHSTCFSLSQSLSAVPSCPSGDTSGAVFQCTIHWLIGLHSLQQDLCRIWSQLFIRLQHDNTKNVICTEKLIEGKINDKFSKYLKNYDSTNTYFVCDFFPEAFRFC